LNARALFLQDYVLAHENILLQDGLEFLTKKDIPVFLNNSAGRLEADASFNYTQMC
jgi:hypothetical protein